MSVCPIIGDVNFDQLSCHFFTWFDQKLENEI